MKKLGDGVGTGELDDAANHYRMVTNLLNKCLYGKSAIFSGGNI